MIINHNLPGANAISRMNANAATASKSMQKLSSGLRINTAGDDAAGLAISEKMRGQIRGLDQASANAQDGISMVQTAEGALNETHSILQRMKELATQASNDTNTTGDRKEIQKEMNQLTSEINRIGNTTEFNTQKLLKGGAAVTGVAGTVTPVTQYAGGTPAVSSKATVTGASGDTLTVTDPTGGSHDITITQNNSDKLAVSGAGGNLTISLANATATNNTASAIQAAVQSLGTVDGTDFSGWTFAAGGSWDSATDGSVLTKATDKTTGGTPAGAATPATFTFDITTNFADGEEITVGGKTYTAKTSGAGAGEFNIGVDANTSANALATLINGDGTNTFSASEAGGTITLTQRTAAAGAAPTVTVAAPGGSGFNRTLQIGANQDQSFNVQINDMRASVLGVSGTAGATAAGVDATDAVTGATFAAIANTDELTDNSGTTEYALDVTDNTKASAAIKVVDQAIASVSSERSKLGAYSNRLEHTIANLGTSSENLTSAESRIRDVDMAKEMSTFSKNNILSQAAQAMLAQANQQPQQVLQLLR